METIHRDNFIPEGVDIPGVSVPGETIQTKINKVIQVLYGESSPTERIGKAIVMLEAIIK